MAANIASNLATWSTTAASNQPDSTDPADLVSDLQQIQSVVRKYLRTIGTDIASASTTDLANATGDYVSITGTTTITALGTVSAGMRFILSFAGALTLTHNATSLILPTGADIETKAGDIAVMESLGSGNWKCIYFSNSSGSSFIQSGTGAVATTVQTKLRESVSVKDFGAVGDGITDDYAAIMAAIDSATYPGTWLTGPYVSGPAIYFPPGIYYISATIELKKRMTLFGDGSGMPYGDAAILKFPIDTTGIIVHTITSGGLTHGGDASLIRGLAFYSAGGTDTTKHGIWLRGRATIEKCYIENFPGDGYHIEASAGSGGLTEGNANNFQIIGGRVNDCGGHGLYVDGADANAGLVLGLDCSSNGGWGIWDSSFLGNTYIGTHTASNTLGSYKTDNLNARCLFLNPYAEGGQPDASVIAPSMIIGGAIDTGSSVALLGSNSDIPWLFKNSVGVPTIYLGQGQPLTSDYGMKFPDTGGTYNWTFEKAVGRWGYKWANLGFTGFINFYDRTATPANGYARDLSAEDGAIGIGAHYFGNYNNQMYYRGLGTAAPASGTWLKGDIVWNETPAAAGYIGWVCVTAGTPGTWKGFGLIQA